MTAMGNEFNFARAPFTNERLPRFIFALAVAAVVGLTAVHGFFLTRYLRREQEELDIQVAELRRKLSETEQAIVSSRSSLAERTTALSNERTRFLTSLYRRKSFSWTGLFNELEAIVPPSVRITSVTPLDEQGEIAVTLTVVGRSLADVLELVRRLEASSFFATVFPVDESKLDEVAGDEAGISATLKLRYVEPGTARGEP